MPESDAKKFSLLDYLDTRVDELRKLTPAALRGEDTDAVHDARVATRRLKAAIDLLDPLLSSRCQRAFSKVSKSLRKQLGPLRDLDVMLEHLGKLSTPIHLAATTWLRARLDACRNAVVEAGKDETPPSRILARLGAWWGVRQDILDGREQISRLLTNSIHLQLTAFAEQARQLVEFLASDPATRARNDPHQLRIAGKSLRYTMEMAKEHGVNLPAAVMRQFKSMQECLGLWHDYIVLTERMLCETVDCDLALHDPGLQSQILKLAQLTLNKAQSELRKMANLWSRQGDDLSVRIRSAFPLTKPAEVAVITPSPRPARSGSEVGDDVDDAKDESPEKVEKHPAVPAA